MRVAAFKNCFLKVGFLLFSLSPVWGTKTLAELIRSAFISLLIDPTSWNTKHRKAKPALKLGLLFGLIISSTTVALKLGSTQNNSCFGILSSRKFMFSSRSYQNHP